MPAHSRLLAPSGAAIWLLGCAGSGHAQAEHPDLYSLPAEEGTAAAMHSDISFKLNVDADVFRGRKFNDIDVTEDQIIYIQGYLELVRSRPGKQRFHEHRMALPQINKDLFGTLDSAVYDEATKILFLCDLKYGFDDVTAVNNPQLWIYAVMLLIELKDKYGIVPTAVHLTIFQPRTNTGDRVSIQRVTVNDIMMWAQSVLVPGIAATLDPHALRTPGKWCKHCKAKINCPEYGKWSNYNIEPPFPVDDKNILKIMEVAPTFKRLEEQAKAYGTERLQRGFEIPGTKLIRKVKHRAIDDKEQTVADLLSVRILDAAEIYKPLELKTPAQLDKIVRGRDDVQAVLDDHIYKPRGDESIALLSSSRPAVATTREVFENE